MRDNHLKIFYSIATLFWLGIIFWSSAISDYSLVSGQADGQNDLLSDLVHLLTYAVLSFLFIKLFINCGWEKKKSLVYGFLLTALYGLTDEWHQAFVPGREMHLGAWLLDVAAALIVVSFYRIKIKK